MNGTTEEWHEVCGAEMPAQDLVRGWSPKEPEAHRNFIDRKIDALGGRHGASLLERVITAPENELRPRFGGAAAAAFAISLLVVTSNLLINLAGLYLIIWGWPDIISILGGLMLAALAWTLWPQLGFVPEDCLRRREFPNLFSMLDGIAAQLSIKPVEHVRVDHRFASSLTEVGRERTPVLTIGLPLWASLGGQERVALIGHELAHRANGDPARGTVVGCGLAVLDRWLDLTAPADERSFADVATHLVMRLLGGAVGAVRALLARLLFLDSQRAEYLADHLAAKIAGPVATVKLLGKLGLDRKLKAVAERAYYADDADGRQPAGDVFRNFVETMPDGEGEAIGRTGERENSRTDAAHPPTASRVRFIRSRHFELPLVVLSDTLSRAIDEELRPFREGFAAVFVEPR
ncbi:MAG: M48 family metallopeptidase [Parvibaculaceae bacterium]